MRFADYRRLAETSLRNAPKHAFGSCPICGRPAVFVCTSLKEARNNMLCCWCRSTSRKRHVAHTLLGLVARAGESSVAALGKNLAADVYSAAANDPLHRALRESPRFRCSEYFDGVAPGASGPGGIECQDLERLTFPDASLDVVVTEDVLEHVHDPARAFREIWRVLRPGGHHVFTVPCPTHTHLARPVVPRIERSELVLKHLLPPAYHGDPIRGEVLVATDFGTNLMEDLFGAGFETIILLTQYWLSLRHGIFDSYVFLSRKRERP